MVSRFKDVIGFSVLDGTIHGLFGFLFSASPWSAPATARTLNFRFGKLGVSRRDHKPTRLETSTGGSPLGKSPELRKAESRKHETYPGVGMVRVAAHNRSVTAGGAERTTPLCKFPSR